ncbi:hypothetical protein G8J22_00668 [Lentilactobacillus hilgardii]|uniref:Eco57I restriction-modification methylase domain-containing protein n=1 Tax=Lentilactobacillus hilgardii TaxID=1588 RepID=UPI00019C4D72|nr:Eco57I restriction-modification methylase domain-containing protein [Lentilactobacillus hilgardii]EEI20250.1 hypothetical protein HMPREF0497_0970 [Lentilactobacillus buchneri ATCC 11577]MCT3396863.1 hypothetical protein [Lentilactobacillus hilgardii]QIR08734.1 hypothetical protein G8J22_00668 [Lentilactobacillus hilgardii]
MLADPKISKKNQIKAEKIWQKERKAYDDWQESLKKPLFPNSLEWRMEFPEILDNNGTFVGFDAIIMNPPYIYSRVGKPFTDKQKEYFLQEYPLNNYQLNSFGLFLNLALKLLNHNGIFSIIIPNSFMTVNQYAHLRSYLLKNTGDLFILNSKDKIFNDASIDNCIISAAIKKPNNVKLVELKKGVLSTSIIVQPEKMLQQKVFSIAAFKTDPKLISLIEEKGENLANIAKVVDGLKVYEAGHGNPKQPYDTKDDLAFTRFKKLKTFFSSSKSSNSDIPFLDELKRYGDNWDGTYLHYGPALAAPRKLSNFTGPRILIRQVPANTNYPFIATFKRTTCANEQKIKIIRDIKVDPLFLLAVIESKLEAYYCLTKFDFLQRNTFPSMRVNQINEFIMPIANQQQLDLANLANQMLIAVKNNSRDLTKQLNDEIDEMVMNLFDLREQQKQKIRDFDVFD